MSSSAYIIQLDEKEQLDEIISCRPQFFHLERMSDNAWWIGLTTADGQLIHINLNSDSKAFIRGCAELQGSNGAHSCLLCAKGIEEKRNNNG